MDGYHSTYGYITLDFSSFFYIIIIIIFVNYLCSARLSEYNTDSDKIFWLFMILIETLNLISFISVEHKVFIPSINNL